MARLPRFKPLAQGYVLRGQRSLGSFVWYNLNNGVVTTSRFAFAFGGLRFALKRLKLEGT